MSSLTDTGRKHIAEIAMELEIKLEVISTGKFLNSENYIQHSDIHQFSRYSYPRQYIVAGNCSKIQRSKSLCHYCFYYYKIEFASITYRYKSICLLDFIDKNLNEAFI